MGYLGEAMDSDCGNCDICLSPPERFEASEAARKILSCVYRVGQSFGIKHVVDVLRGSDSERIRNFGYHRLSTFGIGMEYSHAQWTSITRQLIHHGYLVQDIRNFSVLKLTAEAQGLLRSQQTLELARPRIRDKAAKKPAAAVKPGNSSMPLFEALRRLRKKLAEEKGVPPYVIFGDASLVEMSQRRPSTEAEFLDINGVGQVKLQRYGAAFLDVIASQAGS
jgi:ATP-dependent DNA helicase RecQ